MEVMCWVSYEVLLTILFTIYEIEALLCGFPRDGTQLFTACSIDFQTRNFLYDELFIWNYHTILSFWY